MLVAHSPQKESAPLQQQYWAKIYTITPYCIYFFGPFSSPHQAEIGQAHHISRLEDSGQSVVYSFIIQPSSPDIQVDSCQLAHRDWLHTLMEDALHIKIPVSLDKAPQLIEHHTLQDAYCQV